MAAIVNTITLRLLSKHLVSAVLGAGGLERVTSSLAWLEHKGKGEDGVREASREGSALEAGLSCDFVLKVTRRH